MDPTMVVGLVSSVLAFVNFSTNVVRDALEIRQSVDGSLQEDKSRRAIVDEMRRIAAKLLPPDDSQLIGEERELCKLASECRALSGQLIDLLVRSQPKDPKSKRQSLKAALMHTMLEKEKARLEQKLDYCRSQLELQLTFLTR